MKIFKILIAGLGYFCIFTIALFIFCYFKMPWLKIQDKILSEIESNTGLFVRVKEIKPNIVRNIGLQINKCWISLQPISSSGDNALMINKLSLNTTVYSLLMKEPLIDITSAIFDGELKGNMKLGLKNQNIKIDLKNINIESLAQSIQTISAKSSNLMDSIRLFKGLINGDLELSGDLKAALASGGEDQSMGFNASPLQFLAPIKKIKNGNLQLRWKDAKIPALPLQMGFSSPALELSNVSLQAQVDDGILILKQLSLGGLEQSIDGKIDGRINLKNDTFDNLKIRFRISDNLKKDPGIDIMTQLIKDYKWKDDYYVFTLSGPTYAPRMSKVDEF